MWISKKNWNEMEEKISTLEKRNVQICEFVSNMGDRTNNYDELKKDVEKLISAHKKVEENDVHIKNGLKLSMLSKISYVHNESKVNTSKISDVTLEELARYVIDNEPIVREENVKVKVEYR